MNGSYRGIASAHANGGRLATGGRRGPGAGLRGALRLLFALTLGCRHRHKSFPFTPVQRRAPSGIDRTGTYVVCLDCGKTFDYDWSQMRMAKSTNAPPIRGSASVQPRMPAIKLEPPLPLDTQHRFETARSRVRSLTA